MELILDDETAADIECLTPEEQAELDALLVNHSPSLAEYVETVKHIRLDAWQIDLCERLEKAFWLAQAAKFKFGEITVDGADYVEAPSGLLIAKTEFTEKRNKGTRAAIHAAPQFGKSIIISQCYPAWILGYDPIHRFRLSTYNVFHSARFSVVIKHVLLSPEHKAFFPDPAGHINPKSKAVEWSTNARLEVADGQSSFTALGLQSGFTGTGADTLLIDDPYKSMEEALSEVIRDKTWRFHTDTAAPRLNDQSNEFIMFHRYHQDDMGGRAIASGEFDLWRYAAEADGAYEDEESGRVFVDPMLRPEGEYLSDRFSEAYYTRQKINEQVWNSQFQGRPTSKSGNLFDVSKIRVIQPHEVPALVHEVRAWDNAATEGGGAFTAGVRMGIDASGRIVIRNVKREQVGTAERLALQYSTADEDGLLVQIHAPQDPGSAGKDVAFQFEQALGAKGFNVTTTMVSGSKEMRAYPLSQAVNSGLVDIVDDGWDIKAFKNELHNFPLGTYKDQVDAASDGYSHLFKLFHRGLVIKNFNPFVNLVSWQRFAIRFGAPRVPEHWEVSAGIKFEGDSSKPSAWCITARAAENANLGEAAFIVAAARMFTGDAGEVLLELKKALRRFCAKGVEQVQTIFIARGNAEVIQLAQEKFDVTLTEFADDETAGVPETNWYFQPLPNQNHPFENRVGASHCYLLVDGDQIDVPVDDNGLLSTRQELATWAYNDKGEPQPFGGPTLNCARMTLYNFALSATAMTKEEKRIAKLPDELKPAEVLKHVGMPDFVERYMAQQHAVNQIKIQEEKEEQIEEAAWARVLGGRPVRHRRR